MHANVYDEKEKERGREKEIKSGGRNSYLMHAHPSNVYNRVLNNFPVTLF